jgi:hypothetical protein
MQKLLYQGSRVLKFRSWIIYFSISLEMTYSKYSEQLTRIEIFERWQTIAFTF